jgi:lysozyme family protein
MKENFDDALKALLKHEGGFVNHPKDPGGMTNLGVTKKVWEEFVGHEVDEQTMRGLTPESVAPLYKQRYWDAVRGDDLPSGVDFVVFDCAVNSGVGRASKFLQRAVNVADDGKIGSGTLAAVNSKDPKELLNSFCDQRQAFLESLPTFDTFGKGWTRRVLEVREQATHMATA